LPTFFKSNTLTFKFTDNMGRGDAKTKRGKINRGSHGKSRPKLKKLKTIRKIAAQAAA
jgi:ribosomal small subunit protein bTHX